MDRIYKSTIFLIAFSILSIGSFSQEWNIIEKETFNIFYTIKDSGHIVEYTEFVDKGIITVISYFEKPFNQKFDIYIHPNRESLNKQWQTDWQIPEFKSECWMVASGVSTKMDILSPAVWQTEACEHSYKNKLKTQNLITHELVHIYHGQKNVSPDFFNTYGINWFIEGLATYVSGQCDSARITEVKKAISNGSAPNSLDEFWSGNLRYGLSGTMLMFIEHKYGRKNILKLLSYNKLDSILDLLDISEIKLIEEWNEYMLGN